MPDAVDELWRRYSAPVGTELFVAEPLAVDGAVPPVLDGLYLRNGPNPYRPEDADATWWSGDGMVHAVDIRRGAAVSYRNRWVNTRRLSDRTFARPPRGALEVVDGPANAGVIWHGGLLLALDGVSLPHRLTADLSTVCVEDFDGLVTAPVCARPRIDPLTGAMSYVGSDPHGPPYLHYHEHDAAGELVHATGVDVDGASYCPDFAMSARRVVVFDTPARYDRWLVAESPGLPYRWDPQASVRAAVLARGATGDTARWSSTEPCLPVQVVNAWDEGDCVVADVVCRGSLAPDPPGVSGGRFERWRFDQAAASIARTVLDDRPVAQVRSDDTLCGLAYRFAYALEASRQGGAALVRFDLVRDEAVRWEPGADRVPGEPVFVRDPDGHADDEGWLLVLVYDAGRDASDLVVLDASSMGRPEAVVHLPARVPAGLHAAWVPGDRFR